MPRRRLLAIMSAVMVALFLSTLEQTVVGTALPRIAGDLGGVDRMSWVVTAYMLASTVTILLYGKLSDLYGRRRLFLVALGVFFLGSVLAGTSQDMTQLVVWRGVQGAGAGGIWPLSMAIIGDVISPRDRGRWQGVMGVVFAVASVAGPALGGAIADHTSWRWVFLLNVPLTLGAIVVVMRTLHVPVPTARPRVDYAGAALLAVCVTSLLLALVWGGTAHPWGSPVIVGLLAGGAAALALFLRVEARVSEPILPLSLFRNHTIAVATFASFLIGAGLLSTMIFYPLFVQGVIGKSATGSGAVMIPFMFAVIISGVLTGQAISRTGRYKVFPVAGACLLVAASILIGRMDAASGDGEAVRNVVLLGLGMGLISQVLIIAAQNDVARRQLGVATSLVNFSRTIGSAIGIAALGALFTHRLQAALPAGAAGASAAVNPDLLATLPASAVAPLRGALASALHQVFLVGIPLAAALLVATFLLREKPLRTTAHVGLADEMEALEPIVLPDKDLAEDAAPA